MGEVNNANNLLSSGFNDDHRSEQSANDDSDGSDESGNQGGLGPVVETQFEDPQDFCLINQAEVQAVLGNKVTLKLKYAILQGCSLILQDEIPQSEQDAHSRVDPYDSFDQTP